MNSSNTNKPFAAKVKALLMRAWRDRWSDIQWGVYLKQVLANSNGDPKELPEILLQQALVGPNPNILILSYLKHTVLSQVVPASSVFSLITSYDDLSKPYCVLELINLAEAIATNMSFTSNLDNSITRCRYLQNVLHWLMLCTLQSLQRIKDVRQQQEYISIIDTASTTAQKISDNVTVQSLLYVAMSEDTDKYQDFEQTKVNVHGTLSQLSGEMITNHTRQRVVATLKSLSKVQDLILPSQAILEVPRLPVCPTINAFISLEAVLNPANDVQPFVDQLRVIERLMKLSRPYLFCEMLRGCFMGLIDSCHGQEELKWAAFMYIKLPQIFMKIQQQAPGKDFDKDLEQGFDMLLNSTALIDLADTTLNCDCFVCILNECKKLEMLSESQYQSLVQRRIKEHGKTGAVESSSTQASPSLIVKAIHTVTSILKKLQFPGGSSKDSVANTLDADYTKNQEAFLGVLCHMMNIKSFELILAAAAATGKLQIFATKLIKINEFAKQTVNETAKTAQSRSLLFDMSFLLLCHITQTYGFEIITSAPEYNETFFVQWMTRCMPEDGKYKCPDNMAPTDQSKVDILLNQLINGVEMKPSMARWHEICSNLPHTVQEILFAWEHGALTQENVMLVLEGTKNKMCCIPIILSCWLCSYMNTVGVESRDKPLLILQHLQGKAVNPEIDTYYQGRSLLMSTVIQKIVNDILPHQMRNTSQQYIPPESLPLEVMQKTLKTVFKKGLLELQNLHTLEQLLTLCGSDWFCDKTVHIMLESNRTEDLSQALALAFAIFHMDLEHICLSLLFHTVPKLLQLAPKQHMLTDPCGYTLAKLCVMTITAAQNARTAEKDCTPLLRRGRKRSRKEVELESEMSSDGQSSITKDLEEPECRPIKRSKSMEPQLTLDSEGFNFDFLNSKDEGETSPMFDIKDPLNKSLANLFRLMNAIVHDCDISPRTSFIVAFIEEAVKCGSQYSRYIFQFMPPNMLPQLMKSVPGVFTNQQILHICDLSSQTGRKVASKAICQSSKIKPLGVV